MIPFYVKPQRARLSGFNIISISLSPPYGFRSTKHTVQTYMTFILNKICIIQKSKNNSPVKINATNINKKLKNILEVNKTYR